MSYGNTPAGFIPMPLAVIQEEIAEDARGEFGGALEVGPSTRVGRFVGTLAEREALIWELLGAIVASRDRASASGVALDDLGALTGTIRREARASRVPVTVGGTVGSVVPAGAGVRVAGGGPRFTIEAAISIGAGGTGSGFAVARDVGPVPAYAGTLTVIENPATGWQTVTNPSDAVLGRLREGDAEYRLRQEEELQAAGSSTTGAIKADVLKAGADGCVVFENVTDVADADGIPAHSIEVVAKGGTDAAVALAVWRSKPAGIRTAGTTSVVVEDEEGGEQTVRITRPAELLAYVRVVIQRGAAWPVTPSGEAAAVAAIKAAVSAFGADNLVMGAPLVWEQLFGPVYRAVDEGAIRKIPTLQIGLAPGALGTADVPATSRQVIILDTSRVTVELT